MQSKSHYQIVISGVGGQGVLFITRLLAEAAIEKGLPVFTSETHGMAQRGGTVISHLKIGEFASPLISPGRADGMIALKAESLDQHGGFLKPGGWAAVNGPAPLKMQASSTPFYLDADRLAREMDDPRSVNLIMLGFTLSSAQRKVLAMGRSIVPSMISQPFWKPPEGQNKSAAVVPPGAQGRRREHHGDLNTRFGKPVRTEESGRTSPRRHGRKVPAAQGVAAFTPSRI